MTLYNISLQPFSDLVHVYTADVCCPCCKYISVEIQNGDEDEFVAFAHHRTTPLPPFDFLPSLKTQF